MELHHPKDSEGMHALRTDRIGRGKTETRLLDPDFIDLTKTLDDFVVLAEALQLLVAHPFGNPVLSIHQRHQACNKT